MTTLPLNQAESEKEKFFRKTIASKERIILTDDGKAVLAVVPIADYQMLENLEEIEDILDARDALNEEGSISIEEFIANQGQ